MNAPSDIPNLAFLPDGSYDLSSIEKRLAACEAALRAIGVAPIAYHARGAEACRDEMARLAGELATALQRQRTAGARPVAFVVGARVRWTSQSSGSRTTKTGKIERVVAAGESIRGLPGLKEPGQPRSHESYLVRSNYGRLYWPRVSTLEVIS